VITFDLEAVICQAHLRKPDHVVKLTVRCGGAVPDGDGDVNSLQAVERLAHFAAVVTPVLPRTQSPTDTT